MPHNLPTKYQPNHQRLWISWWLVPEAIKPKLDKYKAFNKYGCWLPNTRRFRKLIRGILRDRYQGNVIPAGRFDLCFDPGAGYIYSNYGVALEDAILSGRLYPSQIEPPLAKPAQGPMAGYMTEIAGLFQFLTERLLRPDTTADGDKEYTAQPPEDPLSEPPVNFIDAGSGETGQKFPVDNSESRE